LSALRFYGRVSLAEGAEYGCWRITSWNPGARKLKGYAAEEIVRQHFSRFYTEEDQAEGKPAQLV
jgi:PAS domain-containing protein